MIQEGELGYSEEHEEWFAPTSDYAFRSLFGSPQHLEVTAGFVRDFFGVEVEPKDIRLLNNEAIDLVALAKVSDQERMKFVETIRDVTLEIEPAKLTIEMQVVKERNFVKRALHYLTGLYVKSYGSDYNSPDKRDGLKPIWSMNVLAHGRFKDDEPLRVFELRDESSDAEPLEGQPFRLGFFEIPKQLRPNHYITDDTPEGRRTAWAHFFQFGIAPSWAPGYIKQAADT